jgi:Na+-driven multidrug efflux pump
VAAWGILGTLWDVLEDATEAIAEAAEVRCAFLLGAGKPLEAKLSAYKSILLAFIVSSLLSSLVLIWGNDVAQITTSEETLHIMINDLIPLFAVGNIALAVGSMAWTLVGAQGRYAYSTAVGFVGSWCVTVPLAAMFSIKMGYDLQGQTSAVVIGYMVSGTWNTFTLLRSDWKQISDSVIEYNTAHNIDLVEGTSSEDEEELENSVTDATKQQDDAAAAAAAAERDDSCTSFGCYHV